MQKQFQRMTGSEPQQSPAQREMEEFKKQCSLSRKTRLWLFFICFCIGWILMIWAAFTVPQISTHPEQFAILYTLGNIFSLLSTVFLWGPVKQIKQMFDKTRVEATCVFLLAMLLTLIMAFTVKKVIPVLACVIVQALAFLWYSLSYIPYARAAVKKILGCPA